MKKDLAHFLETIDSRKMVRLLSLIVASAAAFLGAIYFLYFVEFHGGFSSNQEKWGQFGDFIGGTVNPVLSFLSLLALVFTVVLQTRQLENSREELLNSKEELKATRDELRKSTLAQSELAETANAQARYANISTQKWPRLSEQLSPSFKWTAGGLQTVQSCPRRRSALATNRPTRWATRGAPRMSSYAAIARVGRWAK